MPFLIIFLMLMSMPVLAIDAQKVPKLYYFDDSSQQFKPYDPKTYIHGALPKHKKTQHKTPAEFVFEAGARVSYGELSYKSGNNEINGQTESLGVSLVGVYRDAYINLAIERSFVAEADADNTDIQREDAALTIGYAINPHVSIFTGYKYGKTTLDDNIANTPIKLSGAGVFLGAGGVWVYAQKHIFSFSAAYANLSNVEYRDNAFPDGIHGRATGTSLSFNWKYLFSQAISYSLSLHRHDYAYEKLEPLSSDINENILSMRFELNYRFR